MGRHKRPHAPGMAFHLFTRTHQSRKWFVPELRPQIAGLIPTIVSRTDASLLAYAVMPNHLHLVIRQGDMELSSVMQPLLRRIAYRVQRFHGFQGGVVERRFRARPCSTQAHLRMALMYVHLNPWRAGLCGDELTYAWTTHSGYRPGSDPSLWGIDPVAQLQALELFSLSRDHSRDRLCRDYLRYLEARMEVDRARSTPGHRPAESRPRPLRGQRQHRDRVWNRHFVAYPAGKAANRRPDKDLRDFMLYERERLGEAVELESLHGSWLPRRLSRIRARLIRAAGASGYRTGDLARFFGITPQAVSYAKYHAFSEK